MGITRAVIGVVAAAGVARLLAPKQTDEIIESAKRAVSSGTKVAKRKAASMTKAATRAAPKAASKAKKTARKTATKMAAKMKSPAKTRKGAKRPARKG